MQTLRLLTVIILFSPLGELTAQTKEEATAALKKAVSFFRTEVGYQGAYLYRYSADLEYREGEGKASPTTGWIEPPGTPFVGEAYLEAYRLTGIKFLLEAALEVADALRKSQLESGGWAGSFELGPGREKYRYRVESSNPRARNYSTLDDEKSQACLQFLMHLDQQTKFKNKEIREMLDYAFKKFLAVQYPNGAWPQQFSGPPDPSDFPVKKARYPEKWSREYPKMDYRSYYTFNDNTMADMMTVMLEAHRIYQEDRFFNAAKRTGDFFLLAQMPDPQPGWAQQYNPEMEPAWARKFEPASISGGESQGVMQALLTLYRATGDKKYLAPLPKALKYYKSSLRPDGKLARFYELHTNKPLYFTKEYELTYSDADMPTHYGFVIGSKLDRIAGEYEKLKSIPDDKLTWKRTPPSYRMSTSLSQSTREVIAALDDRGAWTEKGEMKNYDLKVEQVIDTRTFAKQINTLARFISASK